MSLPKLTPNTAPSSSPSAAPQGPPDQPAQPPDPASDDQPSSPAPQPQPQHQFQPFFTLIENAHSAEYLHPTVHYIFSDDDTDIVTEAALRSLEGEQDGKKAGTRDRDEDRLYRGRNEGGDSQDESGQSSPRKESLLPPPLPGVKDNYIILDVEETSVDRQRQPQPETAEPGPAGPGTRSLSTSPATQPPYPQPQQQPYKVTSAHSLTPSWQVLQTEIVPAPTFDSNSDTSEPVNGAMMLKIRGTPGLPAGIPGRERDGDRERGSQRLEEMMDQFAKRMGELRMVIEAGNRADSTGRDGSEQKGEGDVEDTGDTGQEAEAGEKDGDM